MIAQKWQSLPLYERSTCRVSHGAVRCRRYNICSIFIAVFPTYDVFLLVGLRQLKIILSQGFYELRIDMSNLEGNTKYAKYGHIDIGDATKSYKLTVGRYSGTAGRDSCVIIK